MMARPSKETALVAFMILGTLLHTAGLGKGRPSGDLEEALPVSTLVFESMVQTWEKSVNGDLFTEEPRGATVCFTEAETAPT